MRRARAAARSGSRSPGPACCPAAAAASTSAASTSTTGSSTTCSRRASSRSSTLYHWDLPQALEDAGGWPERATADAFVEYVETVVDGTARRPRAALGDAQRAVLLLVARLRRRRARSRPDRRPRGTAALHHVLLSHGLAVEALRRESPGAQVGIVLDSWPVHPATDDEARRRGGPWRRTASGTRLFFDPMLRGRYPADVLERLGDEAPPVHDGDLETDLCAARLRRREQLLAHGRPRGRRRTDRRSRCRRCDTPKTAMGWEIYPDALVRAADPAPPRVRRRSRST